MVVIVSYAGRLRHTANLWRVVNEFAGHVTTNGFVLRVDSLRIARTLRRVGHATSCWLCGVQNVAQSNNLIVVYAATAGAPRTASIAPRLPYTRWCSGDRVRQRAALVRFWYVIRVWTVAMQSNHIA